MKFDFSTLDGAFLIADGLPRPQWEVIAKWIDEHALADQLDQIWTDAAKQWLARIQAAWGDQYQCFASTNFLLLTTDQKSSGDVLEFCESALRRIRSGLLEAAEDQGFGPHVLIACCSRQHYYDYVCHFYDEGDWATSSGMFLNEGYGHIVMAPSTGHWKETVAHELTHNLLRHLPLPRWLDEGLAMTMEGIVLSRDAGWPALAQLYRLREFWPERGIQAFWRGDSFYDADEDGQHLSYLLARCLVRRLAGDYPKQFHAFIRGAVWNDAGDDAAKAHFNRGLGEVLSEMLGEGDWEPEPITE